MCVFVCMCVCVWVGVVCVCVWVGVVVWCGSGVEVGGSMVVTDDGDDGSCGLERGSRCCASEQRVDRKGCAEV